MSTEDLASKAKELWQQEKAHAHAAEVRLYERLFLSPDPDADGRDPLTDLNPASLDIAADVTPGIARTRASSWL